MKRVGSRPVIMEIKTGNGAEEGKAVASGFVESFRTPAVFKLGITVPPEEIVFITQQSVVKRIYGILEKEVL